MADPGGWYVAAIAAPEHGGAVYLWGGQAGKSSKLGLKGAVLQNSDCRRRRALWEAEEGEKQRGGDDGDEDGEGSEEEDVVVVIPLQEPQSLMQRDATADEDATVVDLALGAGHLLTLLDSGEVLGLGRYDEGQLGSVDDSSSSWSVGEQDQQNQQWVKMTLPREPLDTGAIKVVQRIWAGGWESWMLVDVGES